MLAADGDKRAVGWKHGGLTAVPPVSVRKPPPQQRSHVCAQAPWSWLEHVLQSSWDGSSDVSAWLGLGAQILAQVLLWMLL